MCSVHDRLDGGDDETADVVGVETLGVGKVENEVEVRGGDLEILDQPVQPAKRVDQRHLVVDGEPHADTCAVPSMDFRRGRGLGRAGFPCHDRDEREAHDRLHSVGGTEQWVDIGVLCVDEARVE